MTHLIRNECIFCKSTNLVPINVGDYEFPVKLTSDSICNAITIPYAVDTCGKCKSVQLKYLANPDDVYAENFAGNYGSIRGSMNVLFSSFILENSGVKTICEIGAGNGNLADDVLSKRDIPYTIVDPSYHGSTQNRTCVSAYFDDAIDVQSNTIVMSHVFEHFYDPTKIMSIFKKNKSIEFIYLSFPDLEAFIKQGTYHVLNPEHTFYVENKFLEELFKFYGFLATRTFKHRNHSVFFEFKRSEESARCVFPTNINTFADVKAFFERMNNNIVAVNSIISETSHPVYIWPCAMPSSFPLYLGLEKSKIVGVLDNSPFKFGKYLYGTNLKCIPFENTLVSDTSNIVLLSGGCYNAEIIESKYPNSKFYII